MELSLLIMQQIISMFLMIAVGVLLVKFHVVNKKAGIHLSKIVLNVILPCTIINAFQIEYKSEIINGLLLAFGAAIVCNIILILLSCMMKRFLKLTSVEQASLSYPNCGEILIPLVSCVLPKGMHVYCCAFLTIQLFFIFTHGIWLLSGQKEFRMKAIIKNVNFIAIVIAIVMFWTKIELPLFWTNTIDGFSGMLAPACMLAIGIAIGNSDLRTVLSNKRNYLICFFRLIFLPFIILILIKISGIAYVIDNARNIILIVFMQTASSSAGTVANMAQSYENDAQNASIINVMSVLFLIFTLPIMVILYQLII